MIRNLRVLATGLCLILSTSIHANAQPLFSLTPLTPTTFELGADEAVVVQYRVTNNTAMTRQLTMQPIAGITQMISGAGYCANSLSLTPNQSCILTLLLNSSQLPRTVNHVPVICKTDGRGNNTPDPYLCSRPSDANSLNITVFPTSSPRIIIPLSVNPEILSLQTGGSSVNLTVTNHTTTLFAGRNISLKLPDSWSDVTQNAEGCALVAPNQSCTIVLTPGHTDHASEVLPVIGDNTQPAYVTLSSQTSPTVLSESKLSLGLSVNNTALNAALTGTPRKFIISNTGDATANNVVYSISPSLPAGTAISPASCGSIPAGGTCELTVTPASTESSSASTLTVSGNNTNAIESQIDVLTYGSIYQSGYVFAVNDTTPDTESIAGKAAALSDQASAGAPSNPNGIVWSNNGERILIYAVSFSSTSTDPIPSDIQAPGQTACDARTDGLCTTTNIISYYDSITVPRTNYAAGLCAAQIDGHNDWSLPAINQLSGGGQTIGRNLDALGLGNIELGWYWSSTQENPGVGDRNALYVGFNGAGGRIGGGGKNGRLGVRCIRDLDY